MKTGEPVIEWKPKKSEITAKTQMVDSFYITDENEWDKKVLVSIQDNMPYGYSEDFFQNEDFLSMKTVTDEKIVYDEDNHGVKFKHEELDIDLFNFARSDDKKITGFHITEKIIPTETKVFAFGKVDDKKGILRMTPEKQKKSPVFYCKCGGRESPLYHNL